MYYAVAFFTNRSGIGSIRIYAFIKNEDFERAKFWLTNLIQYQSYDKKFKKLAVLEKKVQ
jgi:hypothetical protein